MSSPTADVVVVGAGLAGLVCARELQRAGLDVTVVERSDDVGGRVRTDEVDGFRCDRGFQLLNPAYPAVRQLVNVAALNLKQFAAGVALARPSSRPASQPRHRVEPAFTVVADPVRAPRYLPSTLGSGYVRPVELLRLAAWAAPALGPVSRILASRDEPLRSSLDKARVTGRVRSDIWNPFFTGVLADDEGSSSARYARLLTRSFLLGRPGVPAYGMSALPRQIAGDLKQSVRLGVAVDRINGASASPHAVVTDAGPLSARAVVVATDAGTAASLLSLPAVPTNGLVTYWFSAPDAPRDVDLLVIDPRGRAAGPVVNAAVMTNVAPSYAPPGRRLVQATTLASYDATETEMRSHLASMFPSDVGSWETVTVHNVTAALPLQRPGSSFRQPAQVADGVFVAGDHRDTASIQGAMVSGRRVACAVIRSLGGSA